MKNTYLLLSSILFLLIRVFHSKYNVNLQYMDSFSDKVEWSKEEKIKT